MQGSHRMGRTTGNIKVDGDEAVQVAYDILAAPERTAGNGTAAAGDNYLGCRNRFVGREYSCLHIVGNWARNVYPVCMARGGHEVNTKTLQVKKGCAENIGVRFTGVAACSRYLPEL